MKTMYIFIYSLLFIPFLFGQVPRTISYQGILTDASGNSKPDGSYTIAFSFYESSTGGEAIWNEIKTLNISKGLFSTSLGDQVIFSANVKFDKPYWLGIKVGNEEELSPRIALTSSGYSFSSINSDTAKNIIDGKVVKSLNGLKDAVTIEGSGGTTINSNGNTITISSSGTGGTGIQGIQNTDNTIDITNPNGPTTTINLKAPLTLSQMSVNSTFTSNNTGTSGGPGISGESPSGAGVIGKSSSWVGTYGETSTWFGVWGKATGSNGKGVFGESTDSYGVWGKSPSGAGVVGESENWIGVYGQSTTQTGLSGKGVTGVYGEGGDGVIGSGSDHGVWGQSANYGVFGQGLYGVYATGLNAAVKGVGTYVGIWGECAASAGNYAGWFVGDVHVNGTFSKTAGSFKIDHPLDPANKYLYHSFVESPDMKNIYDGTVTTDASGYSMIELPSYFQALNMDYRYQLTVIGQFAQAIVETEISNNQFTIRTDKPNVKVSWQVTGIRQDPYANDHRIPVEEKKLGDEIDHYIYPAGYGQPEEKMIHYVKAETQEMKNPKSELSKKLNSEK